METIGSQTREPIEETEYIVRFIDEHLVLSETGVYQLESGPDVVLLNKKTDREELWTKNDDFAGYVIEIGGKGYEFVKEI